MEQNNKVSLYAMLGGIAFAFLALFQLISIVGTFRVHGLLSFIAYCAIAVMLFMKRKDIIICSGFGVLVIAELIALFVPYSGNKFQIFLNVLGFAGIFVIALSYLTDYMPPLNEKILKLWFVPAAFIALGLLVNLINIFIRIGFVFPFVLKTLFSGLISAGAVLLTGLWVAAPFGGFTSHNTYEDAYAAAQTNQTSQNTYGGAYAAAQTNQTSQNTYGGTYAAAQTNQTVYNTYGGAYSGTKTSEIKGYFEMLPHILLLFFTFGIWNLVWIYRTTKYLSAVKNDERRDPTAQLLLCMFVPFYSIYWSYKSASMVDTVAKSKGIPSDIAVLCLIFSIIVPVVSPILIQEKINKISGGDGKTQTF